MIGRSGPDLLCFDVLIEMDAETGGNDALENSAGDRQWFSLRDTQSTGTYGMA